MGGENQQNDGRSQETKRDVAELAAKEAATYFGGPAGGVVADKVVNSKLESQVVNRTGQIGRRGGMPNMPPSLANLASPMPTHKAGINGAGIGLGSSTSEEEITQDDGGGETPPPVVPSGGITPDGDDGDEDKDKNKNNKKSFGFGNFSFKDWPLKYKFIALGVIAGLVLILIVVSMALGIVPLNFLSYSSGVDKSNDIKSEYSEFWKDFCESSEDDCSEEQKRAAEEFEKSQLKFYERLNKLVKDNGISSKQKYIILTTIFLGYDIDDFTEGNKAFELDDDDEINYEASANVNSENIYEREKDSLKELVKQFKISTAICTYDQPLDNGEVASDQTEVLRDVNGKTFTFNFVERVSFLFGGNPKEGLKEAREACVARPNGKVSIDDNFKDEEISTEGFYNYLKSTDYLDSRPQLSSYFSNYAKNNRLSLDTKTWVEDDLVAVREEIIKDIKSIVESYVEEAGIEFVTPTGRAYWWPIGSLETSSGENGALFASGDPQFTHINSPYGVRIHPISGVRKLHDGIDLRGTMGETNIIASLDGVVTRTVNNCVSDSKSDADKRCGGGYGNYVEMQDTKGNVHIYAHMYRDSLTVEKGDIVKQGQVLGKVGSSGSSTGAHLHFTLKINGASVNPIDYIDPADPRPAGLSSSIDFNRTSYTREEFISRLEAYYSKTSCKKAGCIPFRDQILNHGGAGVIYDLGTSHNVNPEIVIARIESEGYSPGTAHNYFGYGCTNTGGIAACYKFTSFSAGMEEFFSNISKYDSAEAMMSKYAYIGAYWYTIAYTKNGGINWGIGGCAYAKYIYPDGIPDRVSDACDVPTGTCTVAATSACVPTTPEDQQAYAAWQVSKMANTIKGIFG